MKLLAAQEPEEQEAEEPEPTPEASEDAPEKVKA